VGLFHHPILFLSCTYYPIFFFIHALNIPDNDKDTLQKEFTDIETLINQATGVLLELYPSLKGQGYSADQVIQLAERYCYKELTWQDAENAIKKDLQRALQMDRENLRKYG
jgi:hypothetical protein